MTPSIYKVPENIETRLFIGNEFVKAKSGKTFNVINPTTEKLTATVEGC
jgi:aldehyde dehydrogenase (NAD+)